MNVERPKSEQPIPEHAKCVFKGEIFDVYQWEQKMFDGSTAIFEKVKRPDTVIVFPVLENGKILLTKQEQPGGRRPFIGAAGGRVNKDEEILAAAKRELLEETGCTAEEFVLWKSLQPQIKIEWAVYVFIGKGAKKVAGLSLDAGEKIETVEVTFDEFMDMARQDNFYEGEVVTDILAATLDPAKKEALRALFI
jgi:ADP-ribose pyrophosphatase